MANFVSAPTFCANSIMAKSVLDLTTDPAYAINAFANLDGLESPANVEIAP